MIINKIRILMVVLLIFIVSLYGCGTTGKAVILKDAKSVGPIKVVRYETPPMRLWSRKDNAIATALPLVGFLRDSSLEKKSKTFSESANLPDYTDLVMQGFVKYVEEEILNWPKMQVENQPVKDTYKYDGGALLVFSAYANVSFGGGLVCANIATMTDQNGTIIWKKESKYRTNEFNKNYPMPFFGYEIEIFTDDNGKFLKEEMSNAANWTIKDLIKHLKGEK
jgi:hypothetical protein